LSLSDVSDPSLSPWEDLTGFFNVHGFRPSGYDHPENIPKEVRGFSNHPLPSLTLSIPAQ